MSDNLKNDILKAVAESNKSTNNTSKPKDAPVFKDPQVLQHSLDKALQGQTETRDKNNN